MAGVAGWTREWADYDVDPSVEARAGEADAERRCRAALDAVAHLEEPIDICISCPRDV
jgi:hypothetical protein